jgi:hypothetical protein
MAAAPTATRAQANNARSGISRLHHRFLAPRTECIKRGDSQKAVYRDGAGGKSIGAIALPAASRLAGTSNWPKNRLACQPN